MNKELSKILMEKAKVRNKYLKWSFWDNYVKYKIKKQMQFFGEKIQYKNMLKILTLTKRNK